MPEKLLKINELVEYVGLSRSSVYRLASLNRFPKPVRIGIRAVAWKSSDINAWLSRLGTD
ncbi:AlpA family phage regulatory protein [Gloeomargaritales cyanobacterium VI4D9]|nr:AlpA family phage regulatory protein [Gloeomargaritales cyanobacterium VI4D9]WAS06417.1 AlpA family phage regulatory protein [Gloeomargaritales cyanobacterium VI4D9]